MPSQKIFISYRREDSAAYAGRLWDRLNERFGEDSVFMDLGMPPGVDFADHIEAAVASCVVLLAVIGPGWLSARDAEGRRRLDDESDFVRLELMIGMQRGVRVIPLLVNGARMPTAQDLPPELARFARRQSHELSDGRWRYDVDRLIDVIHANLAEAQLAAERPEGEPATSAQAPAASSPPGAKSPPAPRESSRSDDAPQRRRSTSPRHVPDSEASLADAETGGGSPSPEPPATPSTSPPRVEHPVPAIGFEVPPERRPGAASARPGPIGTGSAAPERAQRSLMVAAGAIATAVVAAVVALALSDGGRGTEQGSAADTSAGSHLTIYSSLPLQGRSREQAQSVINGEKLALDAAGGKVGDFTIKYVSLDDSTAQNPGTADVGRTAQNARQAIGDKSTIFYLGEFNSSGTKVSLPILNKAGIPQISPSNTYIGLTTDEPGSEPGEPDKYYPTGERTYARVVPRDTVEGAALVTVMKEDGCKTVTLWNDKSTYGAGLARDIKQSAEAEGLTIENEQGTDKNSPNYSSIASKITSDCFVWAGVTGENAVQVYKDVAKAAPNAKLYGPDGVTEEAFSNPKQGGIPASVGARMKTTVATLGVEDLPRAKPVLEKYKEKYKTQTVDPYGIYGYETMALALDVLERAGDKANERAEVVKQLFATKNRDSVLGRYSIDANGDTSSVDYGVYVIKEGIPTYSKKIVANVK